MLVFFAGRSKSGRLVLPICSQGKVARQCKDSLSSMLVRVHEFIVLKSRMRHTPEIRVLSHLQEIVSFAGNSTPLQQELVFDFCADLPKEQWTNLDVRLIFTFNLNSIVCARGAHSAICVRLQKCDAVSL